MRLTKDTRCLYAMIKSKKNIIALHKNAIEALNAEIANIRKEIAYIHRENRRLDSTYVGDYNDNHNK